MADLTLADVRAKYPQYSDMSDADLVSGLHQKFYSDMPLEEFQKKVGFNQKPVDIGPPLAPPATSPSTGDLGGEVKGIADAGLAGLSHLTTPIVSGIAGLGARASTAIGNLVNPHPGMQSPQQAADNAHSAVDDNLLYHAQTPVGKEIGTGVENALAPVGRAIGATGDAIESGGEKIGIPKSFTHEQLSTAGDLLNAAPGLSVLKAPRLAAEAADAAAATKAAAVNRLDPNAVGYKTLNDSPIAAGITGQSGKDALTVHNQPITDTLARHEAGVDQAQPLNYESLQAARATPNAVHDRIAKGVDGSTFSPAVRAQIEAAGDAGRLTNGTPQALALINNLKQTLLGHGAMSGDSIVNELRGLRQEGYGNIGSEDISNQQLGKAQLDMSRALEAHIDEALPKNGDVSLEQLQQARQQLAKNQAVQAAMHGDSVDAQAIGRMQRADPQLLTDGLKTIGDFANNNSAVSGRANAIGLQPSYKADIGEALGHRSSYLSPSIITGITGSQVLARGLMTGDTAGAVDALKRTLAARPKPSLAPIPAKPTPSPFSLAPGTGVNATPTSPGTGIPLADVLAHGVEQSPAAGISLADELGAGGKAPEGVPFKQNADHMAGGLSLMDELQQALHENNSDLPKVASQGVPEGIMTRTPAKPKFVAGDVVKPPQGGPSVAPPKGLGDEVLDNGATNPTTSDPRTSAITDSLRGVLQRGKDSGTVGKLHPIIAQLADKLDDSTPRGAFYKDLFGRLAAKNLPTSIQAIGDVVKPEGRPVGTYFPDRDTVGITDRGLSTGDRLLQTVAHEAVHAATLHAVRGTEVGSQIQQLMDQTKPLLGNAEHYGMTNPAEYVAEIEANPQFRTAMKTLQLPEGGSAWDKYKKIVGTMLGLPAASIAAHQFESLLSGDQNG